MAKEYKYRVAIVKNRKLFRVIQDYKYFKHASNKFNKIYEENQAFYQKKYINSDKIDRVDYEVLLLAKTDGEKKFRKVFNLYGDKVEEEIVGNWRIVKKFPYKQEETFYVYGFKNRLDVADIISNIITPRLESFYYITMVLNKIVIYNYDDDIEVILCKNLVETKRLYEFIFNFLYHQKILNLVFMGTATRKIRSMLYDRMEVHTGLKRQELYRTSTRS